MPLLTVGAHLTRWQIFSAPSSFPALHLGPDSKGQGGCRSFPHALRFIVVVVLVVVDVVVEVVVVDVVVDVVVVEVVEVVEVVVVGSSVVEGIVAAPIRPMSMPSMPGAAMGGAEYTK